MRGFLGPLFREGNAFFKSQEFEFKFSRRVDEHCIFSIWALHEKMQMRPNMLSNNYPNDKQISAPRSIE
jgi:hypothetical protein